MTEQKHKLEIGKVLKAVDKRDYGFYSRLTADEQKSMSPYVLMRFVSDAPGDFELQAWFIERTNELVNKDHWQLSKDHKELQWMLMSACGIGSVVYHQYVKVAPKEKTDKFIKLVAEMYPSMKYDDISVMVSLMSKQDKNDIMDSLGFDKKQRKEYI